MSTDTKTITNNVKRAFFVCLSMSLILTYASSQMQRVGAESNSVIINEIMYNPISGDNLDEYIELYNTTDSDINLEGWCFTEGISVCFEADAQIAAREWATISPYSGQTYTTYGVNTIGDYSGSLSNSGESLTLRDDTDLVVNQVTYSDAHPWPSTPDGTGPSLELKRPNLDNQLGANWGASLGGPTPNLANSYLSVSIPELSDVTDPNDINPGESVTINATVDNANSVELIYKIEFEADVTIAMHDDGLNNDGEADDGVFGANIPGQSTAGSLVRFKIKATGDDGEVTSPSNDDSIEYHGYVIDDPDLSSNAPIINWYMDEDEYNSMIQDHVFDNAYLPAVVAYGDEVYDNAKVRIRGESTRTLPKKSFKFKLPKGRTLAIQGGSGLALNEFNIIGNYNSQSMGYIPTLWWAIKESGVPVPDIVPARIQRNGSFYGLYYLADKYEKEWRQANDYDSGAMFEDTDEAFTDDANLMDMESFRESMLSIDNNSSAKRDYILDNINIAQAFNYMGAVAITGAWDQNAYSNTIQFYDKNKTGRWSSLFWDMDGSLDATSSRLTPFDYRRHNAEGSWSEVYHLGPVYYQSDLRSLYMRRLRTLIDKFHSDDQLIAKYNEIADLHEADSELDLIAWPEAEGESRNAKQSHLNAIRDSKRMLLGFRGVPWGIPRSQTESERESVYIDYANESMNSSEEYIKISSTANTPVDISDWYLEGLNYQIPPGSVIPANGSAYFVRNDKGFRDTHEPTLIFGQYNNGLGTVSSRELVLKTNSGTAIDYHEF